MIDDKKAAALGKWIQQWKRTYKENPSLEECVTWFEWRFMNKNISKNDEESIKIILKFNSEE